MTRWEYDLAILNEDDFAEGYLSDRGRNGWELAAAIHRPKSQATWLYFKRPVQSEGTPDE